MWAGISKEDSGSNVVTWAKTFMGPLWVLNPCRQTYDDHNIWISEEEIVGRGSESGEGTKGKVEKNCVSQVAYSTLEGHLIAGEERFCVDYRPSDETVTFRIR